MLMYYETLGGFQREHIHISSASARRFMLVRLYLARYVMNMQFGESKCYFGEI